jgi:hypothetical protein
MERSLFNLIAETGWYPYEVYSIWLAACVSALIEETDSPCWTSTTSISLSDRIGRRDSSYNTATNLIWPAKLSLKCSLATKIYWHWLRPRNRTFLNVHGSHMVEDDLPTIRFLTLWALDRLPTETCDLDSILCETDLAFMRRQPELPSFFFVTFVQITFGDMGDRMIFMLER